MVNQTSGASASERTVKQKGTPEGPSPVQVLRYQDRKNPGCLDRNGASTRSLPVTAKESPVTRPSSFPQPRAPVCARGQPERSPAPEACSNLRASVRERQPVSKARRPPGSAVPTSHVGSGGLADDNPSIVVSPWLQRQQRCSGAPVDPATWRVATMGTARRHPRPVILATSSASQEDPHQSKGGFQRGFHARVHPNSRVSADGMRSLGGATWQVRLWSSSR
jgi:hypothetical protein